MYAWEFEKGRRKLNVHVDGQLVFNSSTQMINAALLGLGVVFVPEGAVEHQLGSGRLTRVLEDWCPYSSGYHLYYPSRRQSSPAFTLVLDALRYRK
jgi:DNA-binding transcriptional LysR family regulator